MDASPEAAPGWHWVTVARGAPDVFGRPAVALGEHCACCNAETKHTVPSRGQPQVYVPCCEACRRHFLTPGPRRVPRSALVGAVCASLATVSPWFFAPAAVFFWIALTTPLERIAFVREGHHVGLRVRVADQTVLIGTRNPHFAEEIRRVNARD